MTEEYAENPKVFGRWQPRMLETYDIDDNDFLDERRLIVSNTQKALAAYEAEIASLKNEVEELSSQLQTYRAENPREETSEACEDNNLHQMHALAEPFVATLSAFETGEAAVGGIEFGLGFTDEGRVHALMAVEVLLRHHQGIAGGGGLLEAAVGIAD